MFKAIELNEANIGQMEKVEEVSGTKITGHHSHRASPLSPERGERKEMFLGQNQVCPRAWRQTQHTMWRQRVRGNFFFFCTMEKSFQCAQWKELEGKSAKGR